MTHIEYLYQLATLRRIYRDSRMTSDEYVDRQVRLLHEYAGLEWRSLGDHYQAVAKLLCTEVDNEQTSMVE